VKLQQGGFSLMNYGEIIKKIRLSKNMTLRQFSQLTNCDYGNLARLEKSFNVSTGMPISPAIDTLKQICDRSGYSFRSFLEEAGYIETITPQITPWLGERLKKAMQNVAKSGIIDFVYSRELDVIPQDFQDSAMGVLDALVKTSQYLNVSTDYLLELTNVSNIQNIHPIQAKYDKLSDKQKDYVQMLIDTFLDETSGNSIEKTV
jgi:transcriptional regulator with XRE-family HTH domain